MCIYLCAYVCISFYLFSFFLSESKDDQTGDLYSLQPVNDELQRVKDQLKTSMKNKYERLFEGLDLQENESLLNRIYTQLYIIEGESKGVNEEHEVSQMEKTARTQHSQDTPIYCNDIFKASAEPGCEEKDRSRLFLLKASLESEKPSLCKVHSGLG